jgi:hypothetical protein
MVLDATGRAVNELRHLREIDAELVRVGRPTIASSTASDGIVRRGRHLQRPDEARRPRPG